MINVQDVINSLPKFEKFCSIENLYDLVGSIKNDKRFNVYIAGQSMCGLPIYHIEFGNGSTKAMVVGGPHADEPIGSLTVFSLLSL